MTRPGGVWRNWGRTVKVRPHSVEFPATQGAVERSVQAAIRRHRRVKAVGAGHSFTGVAAAPDVLLDLSDLTGLVSVDADRARATLRAGTHLHQIPALLRPHGLAMENLGDIDRQTIAGAISTGTHGTGARFGGLATQVVGATLVTGTGEVLHVDETENAEVLPAVALGLGALGILVDVTVQCVPTFLVSAVERPLPLDELLDDLEAYVDAADHFEFYWFPHTDVALTKSHTRLPATAKRNPLPKVGRWVDESLLSNGVFRAVCATATAAPAIIPSFSRLAVTLTGNREYTDESARVFTQRRTVRFHEMEYALPVSQVRAAFDEVRTLIATRGWRVSFPIEVRFAAADDLWLSTAHGRASAYIAVHRYWREDSTEFFAAVEQVLWAHQGRPHWGKMHTRGADDLRERYPRFDDFLAVRDRLDPHRICENDYLKSVLGA